MRGVSVSIFRSDLGDCTNGGVTNPANSQGKVVVVFDSAIRDGNYRLDDCLKDPRFVCLKVVRRPGYTHCEPLIAGRSGIGPMAGGNYVYSMDSRFTTSVGRYPVPVHDRFETQEQYDLLSR